jgi:hypothetical protein
MTKSLTAKKTQNDDLGRAVPNAVQRPMLVPKAHDESEERAYVRALLRPQVNNALTLANVMKRDFGERSLNDLVEELEAQTKAVNQGNLAKPEALLLAQSITLDVLFNKLARIADLNIFTNIDAAERLFRLALKAQSQSRSTVETLGLLKNPFPTVIAKQANVTTGPQQVNNGIGTSTPVNAHARESEIQQSKLLEQTSGERLDVGAAGEAIDSDPPMATVGAIHRPNE